MFELKDWLMIESLVQNYKDGFLTEGELFANLIVIMNESNLEKIRQSLSKDQRVSFDEWVDDYNNGAEIYLGKLAILKGKWTGKRIYK